MPEYVPVPMVAQASIRGMIGSERCQNTLYWKHHSAEWNAQSLLFLGGGLMLWWTDVARLWLPAQYQFTEIFLVALYSATGPANTVTPETSWVGLRGTGGPMPNNVTLAMAFRSGNRGRGNQGRNFWPGFARGDVVENEIALGAAEGIKDAYSQLMGSIVYPNNVAQWVVVSRYFNKQPRVQGTTAVIQEVVYSDRVIDSMRRRLPGRGA